MTWKNEWLTLLINRNVAINLLINFHYIAVQILIDLKKKKFNWYFGTKRQLNLCMRVGNSKCLFLSRKQLGISDLYF